MKQRTVSRVLLNKFIKQGRLVYAKSVDIYDKKLEKMLIFCLTYVSKYDYIYT